MAKKKWPQKLIVALMDDDTPIAFETPEDVSEDFADEQVAVYELVTIGKFRVEKQVDAKPVKRR